jgi:hypothetical protein
MITLGTKQQNGLYENNFADISNHAEITDQ